MRIDWKYTITVLAAIAGIVAPIWLWQFDLRAKSLVVRLASSVPLQSPEATSIPDLQLTVEGVKIESPVLSTLELINDGAKPILVADFDSALELAVTSPAKVVKARISKSEPDDLRAVLETNAQGIKLMPLLLNQNDKITIAVLTSGSPPAFITKARIAGVSTVRFENKFVPEQSWKPLAVNAVLAIIALVLYFIYGAAIARSSTARLTKSLSVSTMLLLGVFSALAIRRAFELAGVERDFTNLFPLFLLVCGMGLGVFFQAIKRFGRVEPVGKDG